MNTDKELTKLAAKAAGIEHPAGEHSIHNDGRLWDCKLLRWWNPLHDDGDALRLAVKLSLRIWSDGTGVVVESTGYPASAHEYELAINCRGCIYAATRRAIVRAAAAIGESMP